MSDRKLPAAGAARVRLAVRGDEEELLDMCRQMAEENAQLPMCERKVLAAIRDLFEAMETKNIEHGGGIIGVIGEPRKIEAMIFLDIGQIWYSDQWLLQESACYVLPQYRKSSNAKDLLEFAKNCSEHLGLALFSSMVSTDHTEEKIRLFERRLGKRVGAIFIHKPETFRLAVGA